MINREPREPRERYFELLERIEHTLQEALIDYAPFNAEPLMQPVRDILSRGGKRWRPLLLCLTAEALTPPSPPPQGGG
jgi:geranylgeranyl pyrophosphate synthase